MYLESFKDFSLYSIRWVFYPPVLVLGASPTPNALVWKISSPTGEDLALSIAESRLAGLALLSFKGKY